MGIKTRTCNKCGQTFPETREHFGQFKNGRGGTIQIGYRGTCRRCMSAHTRAYDARNPANVRARIERRQERLLNTENYSNADVSRLRKALGDRCRYCDSALNGGGQIDHLTPVARGGTNKPANLTIACSGCNLSKTSKTLHEYFLWRRERKLSVRLVAVEGERPDPVTRAFLREMF